MGMPNRDTIGYNDKTQVAGVPPSCRFRSGEFAAEGVHVSNKFNMNVGSKSFDVEIEELSAGSRPDLASLSSSMAPAHKVAIMETVLRDAQQSLIATRMTTKEMEPAFEAIDA